MAIGRPPGAKNLTTREMKERAAFYGDIALETLGNLLESEDERVRADAACKLLDRGYGKPSQTTVIQGDENGGPLRSVNRIELVDLVGSPGSSSTEA
ncbi:hypothetical protein UFOVP1623_28 [uncultured Caudovirales phage]|uniref:Uncharacterized protein n=1 Tax=uncultured Caudovirales phage TaxID=2100421 RepID=A0A6J5S2A6_9CAUD|nr:hypothetical protein UFOVP1376_35 [uncultured Caudovirales phage]CAB4220739.1 hypothetical protein UFOVP1623_28 [uncultured Caudovirales phage]